MSEELHVVLGGTGGLGYAVVTELARKNMRVRAVNRGGSGEYPAGVEAVSADGMDSGSLISACDGATVIYNCMNPAYNTWNETLPTYTDNVISSAEATGSRLVIGDNLYMYGPVKGPITEDLPYTASGKKGKIRAAMARRYIAAHEKGRIRVAIGRASDFYGPAVFAGSGDLVFRRALAGKKAMALGKVDRLHTWSYTNDFARGLITLGERDEALGDTWHVPSAETITTREFINLVFEEAGTQARVQAAGSMMVALMGLFNPILRELNEMMYEWNEDYMVDHGKFERAFGNQSTPHREAIRTTLEWFRQHPA